MAVSKSQTQVEWSTNATVSVSSAATQASDAVAISNNAIAGSVQVKVDNAGTPTSGDTAAIRILYTNGDPDADPDSGDEYDTVTHALPTIVDTNAEDPVIVTIPVDVSATGFKLAVTNDGASSMTVSAQYSEQTLS